jgi:hypothetical protein
MKPAVQRLLKARIEQGLPEHVEDHGVLAQIATLLNADDGARKSARARKKVS